MFESPYEDNLFSLILLQALQLVPHILSKRKSLSPEIIRILTQFIKNKDYFNVDDK